MLFYIKFGYCYWLTKDNHEDIFMSNQKKPNYLRIQRQVKVLEFSPIFFFNENTNIRYSSNIHVI